MDTYIKDACRTEADWKMHPVGYLGFIMTLNHYMSEADVLDQYKKAIFYGKNLDNPGFRIDSSDPKALHTDKRTGRMLHSIVGVATEAGELVETLALHLTGEKPFDDVHLMEEFGDVLWYIAIALDELGLDFPTVMERNIAKLKARFPDRFTEQLAQERDLDQERRMLEGVAS